MEARKLNFIDLWKLSDKKSSNAPFWNTLKTDQSINKSADQALQNSLEAAIISLPVITALGVKMMCESNKGGGFINLDFRPLGLPIAIGGLVLDAIKAPFCLAIATEEAARGGITKLYSLLFEKGATEQAVDLIFKSFLLRMQETAALLVGLGLEDSEVLNNKLKSGKIEDLVGLTLLYTAYVSRHSDQGLYLATEKQLLRTNCPTEGLPVFDAIMELKKSINQALKIALSDVKFNSNDEQNLEEARVACDWISRIKKGEILNPIDNPNVSKEGLEIVNKIITQINKLETFAMAVLPETPKNVASHVLK